MRPARHAFDYQPLFWFTPYVVQASTVRLFGSARDEAGIMTIFISHVDADKGNALALAGELEKRGYGVVRDRASVGEDSHGL